MGIPHLGLAALQGEIIKPRCIFGQLRNALTGSDLATFVFGSQNVNLQMTEWYSLDCTKQNGHSYLQQLIGGAP